MPKLYLMIGASGSGKTTISKRLHVEVGAIRLSTDECRAICGTGEEDQSVSYKVFNSIYTITEHLLCQNEDVLIDATNISRKSRKEFVKIASKTKSWLVAYVIEPYLNLEDLVERNQSRTRQVPKDIISKQIASFEYPTKNEGFNETHEVIGF